MFFCMLQISHATKVVNYLSFDTYVESYNFHHNHKHFPYPKMPPASSNQSSPPILGLWQQLIFLSL